MAGPRAAQSTRHYDAAAPQTAPCCDLEGAGKICKSSILHTFNLFWNNENKITFKPVNKCKKKKKRKSEYEELVLDTI